MSGCSPGARTSWTVRTTTATRLVRGWWLVVGGRAGLLRPALFILVFGAAVNQKYYILVVIAVLNTAVSAYYYLRLVIVMFFRERTTSWITPQIPASIALAIIISIVGVLYLGIFPGRIINALQTRIEAQLFTRRLPETR